MRQQKTLKAAPGSHVGQDGATATYRPDDLARMLGISRNGVYTALRNGKIPHIRIGRRFVIPKAAVESWFQSIGRQSGQQGLTQ